MNINYEKFKRYLIATNGKKSYLIDDYKSSGLKSVNEFIYISDHFEELKKIYKKVLK